jgi:hypothetical protein
MSYRCDAWGNKTRFDVYERKRVRTFQHFTLGGEMSVEEEETLDNEVERIVCRWCGSADSIVEAGDRPAALEGLDQA